MKPIAKRRSKPRRGRVVDEDFIAWVLTTQVCLVAKHHTDCLGRVTFHHVRKNGSPKNDRRGLALCEAHHLHGFGPDSIERLGKAEFEKRHGVDIEKAIVAYNDRYAEETGR